MKLGAQTVINLSYCHRQVYIIGDNQVKSIAFTSLNSCLKKLKLNNMR